VISGYEPSIVPGLLQIRDYGREVLRCLTPESSRADGLAGLCARRRQEVFGNGRRPEVHFVLDETAVLRWVGAPERPSIMIDQLRHLQALVIEHDIDLRVIPLDRGIHAGLEGPVTVYGFDTAWGLEDVAFVGETAAYRRTFQALHDTALPPVETMRLIDRVIASLPTEEGDRPEPRRQHATRGQARRVPSGRVPAQALGDRESVRRGFARGASGPDRTRTDHGGGRSADRCRNCAVRAPRPGRPSWDCGPAVATNPENEGRNLICGHHYKNVADDNGQHLSAGEERDVPWVAITPGRPCDPSP
jgi:uncharacterized protein DUF5753